MRQTRSLRPLALLPLLVALAMPAAASLERDCGEVFSFLGTVDGLRWAPGLPGELAELPLDGVLSDPWAARRQADTLVAWEIVVEGPGGGAVRTFRGAAQIPAGESVVVSRGWDGRDEAGALVADGTYAVRFLARGVAADELMPENAGLLGNARFSAEGLSIDDLPRLGARWEDSPFTDPVPVFVDRSLDPAEAAALRFAAQPRRAGVATTARTSAPHEPIPYKFWYGAPHAHTTRSDGGGSATGGDCASSDNRVDGSYPDDAYTKAKTLGDLDWLMIAEHDHLLDNAAQTDTRAPKGTGSTIPKDIYAQGRAYADAATTSTFVGFYGMEWGTISNCGHVNMYDVAAHLVSTPDPTASFAYTPEVAGPACQYADAGDLFDLANRSNTRSPATGMAHLVLNHPTDANMFESYKKTAFGDAAVRGVAIISGSATSCATNFPTGGTGSTGTFKDRFVALLTAGWKVAPEGHQDNHGDNYGNHSEVRTVVLAENLTRECLLKAQAARRVYTTQDRDGQLIFTAKAGNGVVHQMGEEMGGSGGVNLHASFWQPDNDAISSYRILRGQVGGTCSSLSCLTAVATGTSGTPSGAVVLNVAQNLASGTYYYFVEILQPGKLDTFTRHTVSAPIWVNFGIADAGTTPASCGGTAPTTYSIAGNAGTSGATVTAGTASATSDASGNYTLSGLAAGTYTVSATKSGCTFSPASQSVTVGPSATGKNFTATCGTTDPQLTSGVALAGQSVAQGAWKYYWITVPAGATSLELKTTAATADVDIYTQVGAKPTSSSYVCRPYTGSGNETCTQASPAAGTWWIGVYGYAAAGFTVTGTVTTATATYSIAGNAGTSGATVTAGAASATSDASGNYTLSGLAAGTYTVSATKSGCTFSPTSQSVTVGPSATGKNFTATCGTTDPQLTSGVALAGQSVAQGAWKYYWITVPAGATSLELKTTAATADVDIYTQVGAKPTSSSYVCRPYTGSGNETCTQASPAAGTWWIGVYGYAAASFTVTGTVTAGGGTTVSERLANGGFETITASTNAAPDGSWSRTAFTGTSYNTLVASGSYPRSGTDHAYLGVNNSSTQQLTSASVTIPAGATTATLSLWVSVQTTEGTTTVYDKLDVQVVNASGVATTIGTISNRDKTASAGTYVEKSWSVLGYKGQSVKVRLSASNGSSYATTFRVDDVSLKSDG